MNKKIFYGSRPVFKTPEKPAPGGGKKKRPARTEVEGGKIETEL